MTERKYALVTVAHEEDHQALRLQAKSLAINASPDLVAEILVVENFTGDLKFDWRDDLRAAYGGLSHLVRFVDYRELAPRTDAPGWWTQQLGKLLAADLVTTEFYVVLDAKNILAFPLERSFLENPAGKPRLRGAQYHGHPLSGYLDSVIAYFGLEPQETYAQFPTTAPPFVMSAPLVMQMMREIEEREGRPFARFFLEDRKCTEFFLYSGWLRSRGLLEATYELHDIVCPTIWADKSTAAWVEEHIRTATASEGPFFGIHRGALMILGASAVRRLSGFLQERGLFPAVSDAQSELLAAQADLRRRHRYDGSLVGRARRKLRSLLGRLPASS